MISVYLAPFTTQCVELRLSPRPHVHLCMLAFLRIFGLINLDATSGP